MRRLFYGFFATASILFTITSCELFGPATNTTEGYIEGIYTIKAKTVVPELSDTFYYISNFDDFDLQQGERAFMRVTYNFDTYYGPRTATWKIDKIINKIETSELTAPADIDQEKMSSHINGVNFLFAYEPVWIWDNKQNINVVYYTKKNAGEFKMSPIGIINDTLHLRLWSDIEKGELGASSLCTFDLSNVDELLNEADRETLSKLDTLHTRITTLYLGARDDAPHLETITGGKCVNPFRK